MTEFKKEDKFLVVKLDDINQFFAGVCGDSTTLSKEEKERIFSEVLDGITTMRKAQGKKDNKYLIVNQDEPYADLLWEMILFFERLKQMVEKVNQTITEG